MNLQDRLSDLNFEISHFNEIYPGMESGGSYYNIDRFANEITKTKNDLPLFTQMHVLCNQC